MKLKNNKAVELSLNLVIIGIILLIVAAVVIFIFSTQFKKQSNILDGFTDDLEEETGTKTEDPKGNDQNADTKGGIVSDVIGKHKSTG